MLKAISKLQSIRCGLRRPTGGDVATHTSGSWMTLQAIRCKNKRPTKLSTATSLIQM
jgi:hypothetical protein